MEAQGLEFPPCNSSWYSHGNHMCLLVLCLCLCQGCDAPSSGISHCFNYNFWTVCFMWWVFYYCQFSIFRVSSLSTLLDSFIPKLTPSIKSSTLWWQARTLLLPVPLVGEMLASNKLVCYFHVILQHSHSVTSLWVSDEEVIPVSEVNDLFNKIHDILDNAASKHVDNAMPIF